MNLRAIQLWGNIWQYFHLTCGTSRPDSVAYRRRPAPSPVQISQDHESAPQSSGACTLETAKLLSVAHPQKLVQILTSYFEPVRRVCEVLDSQEDLQTPERLLSYYSLIGALFPVFSTDPHGTLLASSGIRHGSPITERFQRQPVRLRRRLRTHAPHTLNRNSTTSPSCMT